jgi:hypothetical protein
VLYSKQWPGGPTTFAGKICLFELQMYSNVLSMDISVSESFTRHELSVFVDMHVENALVWGSKYNVPASGSKTALSCDIEIC